MLLVYQVFFDYSFEKFSSPNQKNKIIKDVVIVLFNENYIRNAILVN